MPLELFYTIGLAVINSMWQMGILYLLFRGFALFTKGSFARKIAAYALLMIGFCWFCLAIFSNLDKVLPVENISINIPQNYLNTTIQFVAIAYLVLLLYNLSCFASALFYLRTIKKTGLQKLEIGLKLFLQDRAERLGIKQKVGCYISSKISVPLTIGVLKPIILLPVASINSLTTSQIEAVLLHELAHIKQYDFLLNIGVQFIRSMMFFNPFVKYFVQIISEEREKSADKLTLQFQYNPLDYAEALLAVAKAAGQSKPCLLLAASGSKKQELLIRIREILGTGEPTLFISRQSIAMLLLSVLIFLWPLKQTSTDKPQAPVYTISQPIRWPLFVSNTSKLAKSKATVLPNQNLRKNIASTQKKSAPQITKPATEDAISVDNNNQDLNALQFIATIEPSIENRTAKEERQIEFYINNATKIWTEYQANRLNQQLPDSLNAKQKDRIVQVAKNMLLAKIDTAYLKNTLRLNYENINWKNAAANINKTYIQNICDSLTRVCTEQLNIINEIESLIRSGMPTPDNGLILILDQLNEIKQSLTEGLKMIRRQRPKKIIEL